MLTTIVADDLTGACDAGSVFAGPERVGVVLDPEVPPAGWRIAVVDTETRRLGREAARTRIREAGARLLPRLRGGRAFKKIDSTMRGHVAAEIDALLEATGLEGAVVCPTFPEQGRTVKEGRLTVNGRPAHETTVGHDHDYPSPTSHMVDLLAGTERPVIPLPLHLLRRGGPELPRLLRQAQGCLIAADAETKVDLEMLARALLHHGRLLAAGSAGLAGALASSVGIPGYTVSPPSGRAWLFVLGSANPATRAQADALEAAGMNRVAADPCGRGPDPAELASRLEGGKPVLITPPAAARSATASAERAMAAALARLAADTLREATPDLLVMAGGETALAVVETLGAARLELLGTAASGVAISEIEVGGSPLPILTKAGGFGAPHLLVTLWEGATA
jgi:uncharacterized protein YgbK (DUF1537 family)